MSQESMTTHTGIWSAIYLHGLYLALPKICQMNGMLHNMYVLTAGYIFYSLFLRNHHTLGCPRIHLNHRIEVLICPTKLHGSKTNPPKNRQNQKISRPPLQRERCNDVPVQIIAPSALEGGHPTILSSGGDCITQHY